MTEKVIMKILLCDDQAVIRDGLVKDVTILSGPKVFHSAVRSAMLQYKCVSGDADIVAVQQFVFEAG